MPILKIIINYYVYLYFFIHLTSKDVLDQVKDEDLNHKKDSLTISKLRSSISFDLILKSKPLPDLEIKYESFESKSNSPIDLEMNKLEGLKSSEKKMNESKDLHTKQDLPDGKVKVKVDMLKKDNDQKFSDSYSNSRLWLSKAREKIFQTELGNRLCSKPKKIQNSLFNFSDQAITTRKKENDPGQELYQRKFESANNTMERLTQQIFENVHVEVNQIKSNNQGLEFDLENEFESFRSITEMKRNRNQIKSKDIGIIKNCCSEQNLQQALNNQINEMQNSNFLKKSQSLKPRIINMKFKDKINSPNSHKQENLQENVDFDERKTIERKKYSNSEYSNTFEVELLGESSPNFKKSKTENNFKRFKSDSDTSPINKDLNSANPANLGVITIENKSISCSNNLVTNEHQNRSQIKQDNIEVDSSRQSLEMLSNIKSNKKVVNDIMSKYKFRKAPRTVKNKKQKVPLKKTQNCGKKRKKKEKTILMKSFESSVEDPDQTLLILPSQVIQISQPKRELKNVAKRNLMKKEINITKREEINVKRKKSNKDILMSFDKVSVPTDDTSLSLSPLKFTRKEFVVKGILSRSKRKKFTESRTSPTPNNSFIKTLKKKLEPKNVLKENPNKRKLYKYFKGRKQDSNLRKKKLNKFIISGNKKFNRTLKSLTPDKKRTTSSLLTSRRRKSLIKEKSVVDEKIKKDLRKFSKFLSESASIPKSYLHRKNKRRQSKKNLSAMNLKSLNKSNPK